MPILDKDISVHNNVKLWKITESCAELIDLFENDAEINAVIQSFKSESKKKTIFSF